MSATLGVPPLNNQGISNRASTQFFGDLNREAPKELKSKEIRGPSICNTYQNIPQVDPTLIKASNYKRSGAEKYADPFPNDSRPQQFENNGRNLWMLSTLEYNKQKDYPDVITKHPLKVVGHY